jgi:hypothetical protein
MTAGKFLRILIFVVILVNLVIVAVVFLGGGKLPPAVPLPVPNGYDDFAGAAQLAIRFNYAGSQPSESELRTFAKTNAEALRLLRAGLGYECRVPLEYSTNFIPNHFPALSGIKALAQAMQAEGHVAETEQRTNDAMKIYLDIVRLGHECGRGGLVIDHLVGLACQSIGLTALQGVSGSLGAKECHEAAGLLLALEQKRPTVSEVLWQESDWQRRSYGLGTRVVGWVEGMFQYRSLDPQKKIRMSVEAKTQKLRRQSLMVATDLAARAYTLEKGAPPKSVADLVPGYLPSIPVDPLTGTNLVYSPR